MIYSILVGNQEKIKADFEFKKDDYGNLYFGNIDIRQRIRLNKKMTEDQFSSFHSAAEQKCYHIPRLSFISNNNKNMNLSLLNFYSKDKKEMAEKQEDDIVYLTLIDSSYILLDYDARQNEIIQTYHKNNSHRGCVIKLNPNAQAGDEIIYLTARDIKMSRIVGISLIISTEDKRITVYKSVLEEAKEINYYNDLLEKKPYFSKFFRVEPDLGKLMTSTYITDAKNEKFTMDLVKDIPNANVLVIDPKRIKEFDSMFKESIMNERIKAVTTVGIKLPNDFCKKYQVSYLFDFDTKFKTLKCLKSN